MKAPETKDHRLNVRVRSELLAAARAKLRPGETVTDVIERALKRVAARREER